MPAPSTIVLNGIRLLLALEGLVAAARGVWPAVFVTAAALALTLEFPPGEVVLAASPAGARLGCFAFGVFGAFSGSLLI